MGVGQSISNSNSVTSLTTLYVKDPGSSPLGKLMASENLLFVELGSTHSYRRDKGVNVRIKWGPRFLKYFLLIKPTSTESS